MNTMPIRRHVEQPSTYDEALDRDSKPVPAILRERGETDVGPLAVPTSWYFDPQIAQIESERIWRRTWQMACREEDVPEVGDTWVYEVADLSIVIVRSAPDVIKGYFNACLHRGVQLRKCPGRVRFLQCQFHGFTWTLNGKCTMMPHEREFAAEKKNLSLPEVRVGRWDGFVFINPDPDAQPFDEYFTGLSRHFERGDYSNRVKTAHVAKVFPCNWKLLHEAFMESWHTPYTHPQFGELVSEDCSLQDAWGNFSRGIVAQGLASGAVSDTPTAQKILELALGRLEDDEPLPPVPEGLSGRQAYAAALREQLAGIVGPSIDELCDSELIDIFYYTLFPNTELFSASMGVALRFRPYGNSPNESIMDIMVMTPVPEGAERPAIAQVKLLSDDDDFTAAPELSFFGTFFSQDIANMSSIQRGVRNNQQKRTIFARTQELKIRHFYSIWQEQTGLSNPYA